MSETESSQTPSAVFTDTCVLYDYTKDSNDDAEKLFDEYTDLSKVTSQFGYDEYVRVAERRAEACEAWEKAVSDGRTTFGDYRFTTPNDLRERDRSNLRDFQEMLVRNCGDVEALRLINERRRQYEEGIRTLFASDQGEAKVVVLSEIDYNLDLYSRLQMDIQNNSDCRILSDAVEWHASGGSDTFVTSDKGDFGENQENSDTTSSSNSGLPGTLEELGNPDISLQEKINEHIDSVYDSINHLNINQLDKFVNWYDPPESAEIA